MLPESECPIVIAIAHFTDCPGVETAFSAKSWWNRVNWNVATFYTKNNTDALFEVGFECLLTNVFLTKF